MFIYFSVLWLTLGFALAAEDGVLKAHLEELRVKYNSTAAVGYVANPEALCAYAAAGFAQELNKAPAFDVDGRQNFGSITKSLTVTLLAILLAENKIRGQVTGEKSWETTLGMIFPASEYPDYGLMNSPYENVTLAGLSSMFGGMPSDPDTPLRYWDFDIPGVDVLRAITANSVKHNVMRHAGSTLEDHTMFLDQKDFYCSRAQVLKSAQSAHHHRDSAL